MMVFSEKTIKFTEKITKMTRCSVSARKRKCTSFLRAFSRLQPSVEELDVGSSGILAVLGPTRMFKEIIFIFGSEETTPLAYFAIFANFRNFLQFLTIQNFKLYF